MDLKLTLSAHGLPEMPERPDFDNMPLGLGSVDDGAGMLSVKEEDAWKLIADGQACYDYAIKLENYIRALASKLEEAEAILRRFRNAGILLGGQCGYEISCRDERSLKEALNLLDDLTLQPLAKNKEL
jgi:hypothetical protein